MTTMSRQHYAAVAGIVATQVAALAHPDVPDFFPNGEAVDAIAATGHALADYFAADNPTFDRGRFLAACGLVGSLSVSPNERIQR